MPDAASLSVALVTHAALPGGAPDDRLLAAALAREGVAVRFAVWSDDRLDWSASALTLVRSTWDYHRQPQAWRRWLAGTAAATRLLNPPELLAWNTDKRYLRELGRARIPCVPTCFVDAADVPAALALPWDDLIVKPAVAASASGVRRFTGTLQREAAASYAGQLAARGGVLVQPYLPAVETARERSLVFIDGQFSHAFSKPAFNTNADGSTAVQPHRPSAAELAVARRVMAALPVPAFYARVDLVPGDDGPLLMEAELIEPDLGLRLNDAAAVRLAQACMRRLRGLA